MNDNILWHQSGINEKGEPFIQLIRNGEVFGQMTPEEARDHAQAVLEAAEAAEQDSFLFEFARNKIGMPLEEAGKIIVAFREYRQERTGKSQGPRRPTDWTMPPKRKK